MRFEDYRRDPSIYQARRKTRRLFRQRRRGMDSIVALGIAVALVAVASCIAFTAMRAEAYNAADTPIAGGASGAFSGPLSAAPIAQDGTSTPKSEWHQGEVPTLFQTDPAWAHDPYAGSDIATSGCGPTCLSMVYTAITGKTDMGPVEMAAFSEANGYVQDGMTAWALMSDGASELGLSVEELPASESVLSEALEEGRPVIASMLPGDFTTVGHFIVIVGKDSSGKLVVRDPNSVERSMQTWDAQLVLGQCANLWAYSRG